MSYSGYSGITFLHGHTVQGSPMGQLIVVKEEGATDRSEYTVYAGLAGKEHLQSIAFQAGDPAAGINGITDEVLLAIVLDRLKPRLSPGAHREAAAAVERALGLLHGVTVQQMRAARPAE